jgi:hypothetical protein
MDSYQSMKEEWEKQRQKILDSINLDELRKKSEPTPQIESKSKPRSYVWSTRGIVQMYHMC